MLKYSKLKTTATIVLLVLINNVAHIGSYVATNLATFEDTQQNFINIKNNNDNTATHRLTKRMDLESCLGQFDVHKNTIIRTGESQAIGGKYLQGIELETMEECQRLCCETESCDVYIFESKKDGYCYLFECGTPENFHCKFTRHANYTSAVLTPVIRHMNEVTTPHPPVHLPHSITSNISQQEWELSNLKVKPEIRENPKEIGLATAGSSNSLVINNNKKSLNALPNPDTSLSAKVNTTIQCGRFQFACHSGECIAVYNACDGIPQCEDGSDEGPECSGANSNNPVTNSKASQDSSGANKVAALPVSPPYQSALMQQSPQQQLQSMQQHSQNPAMVNNREDPNVWENRKIVSGAPQAVDNQESQNNNQIETQGDGFTSYVNNRGQQNAGQYVKSGSTLEQSGLYMPYVAQEIANNVYAPQQQQQEQHMLLPLPPPPPPAPLNSNWQQQAIRNQQQQQQQQQLLANAQPLPEDPPRYDLAENSNAPQQQNPAQLKTNVVQQQQPAQNQPPTFTQEKPQQIETVADNVVNVLHQQTQLHSKGKMVEDKVLKSQDSDEYEDAEEKSTEPPKKHKHKKGKSKTKDLPKSTDDLDDGTPATKSHVNSVKSIKSAISPVHEQYEIIHQNMALEFRDHDGQSERPGGAVLSLTLGLLITAALAILIGCRMKTVGRRARRLGGKTPYSHEADFLVNGMYL